MGDNHIHPTDIPTETSLWPVGGVEHGAFRIIARKRSLNAKTQGVSLHGFGRTPVASAWRAETNPATALPGLLPPNAKVSLNSWRMARLGFDRSRRQIDPSSGRQSSDANLRLIKLRALSDFRASAAKFCPNSPDDGQHLPTMERR